MAEKLKKQATDPNILAYNPHYKQRLFHKSNAKKRLYIGGNRSGKTVGGICEDIYWIRGEHPYKKVPLAPTRGRIVCVDFNQGIEEIIIPKLRQWCPSSMFINNSWEDSYNKQAKKIKFANGSTVELMTYEQNLGAFAGTSRHWTHFDEEPPQDIYNECRARLVDTSGHLWITMTPLDGMTWVFDQLYEPGIESDDPKGLFVVEVDMAENPFLTQEAIDEFLDGLDVDERKAREHGRFVQVGGKVYKHFDREKHVIPPFLPPKEWNWYSAMDHGFNAPTAWLWSAVAPDGTIVTFAEHYKSEMTVAEHVVKVKEVERDLGKVPDYRIGDPAIQQRSGITGTSISTEYALLGIFISEGNNDVLSGVNKVASYLNINPATGKPYWQITENCPNLIRELQRLRWQTYTTKKMTNERNLQDKIHKKDDHASDAMRYFFSFMPDLKPQETPVAKDTTSQNTKVLKYDEALARMVKQEGPKTRTDWTMGVGSLESLEWDISWPM